MKNRELLNGLFAANAVVEAHMELINDVIDLEALEQATRDVLKTIINSNDSINNQRFIRNRYAENVLPFGVCKPFNFSEKYPMFLMQDACFTKLNNTTEIPVEFDYSKPLSIVIENNDNDEKASDLAQYVLMEMLRHGSSRKFRCADFVQGGNFFSKVYSLVTQLPLQSGKKIYTKSNEMDELIKTLDSAAAKALSQLELNSNSVYEHNCNAQVKIDEYVNVINAKEPEYGYSELDHISILMENRAKNGMDFIIVGNKNVVERFADSADVYLSIRNGEITIGKGTHLKFELSNEVVITTQMIEEITQNVQASSKVDTLIENHEELLHYCQHMDAADVLRIPFAYDKNNVLKYFEIGGEAPTHALISGSTGSGKSVALHTLIMQIVYNYHPDDVEIWAIDYKAVEFDTYLKHRTPHFRVIAHDTSTEFSLSLLDLLYEEYEYRMKKFLETGVKNISEYRKKMGNHSMPRIVVFIDEFQIMTQAVQNYNGNKDYRTILENILRLTRAMGISLVLCSQTIASGLSGLTDSARDQIGCRLSLKHDDDNEIRETLMLWGSDTSEVVSRARNLHRGQGIYKRVKSANETQLGGGLYEYSDVNILYINDEIKKNMIDKVNEITAGNYVPKKEIFVRGGGRISITEKERHPIIQYLNNNYEGDEDCVEWYPAAPTTLEDKFQIDIENTSGANILLVGENDDLRESIVMHSVLGFLMDPTNKVYANFIDEEYSDRARLLDYLRKIKSDRLVINEGIKPTIKLMKSIEKIKPVRNGKYIYIWYGLDKLKNELFLLSQEDDEMDTNGEVVSADDVIDDLMSFLKEINGDASNDSTGKNVELDEIPSFDDCKLVLKQNFEMGSENNHFHFVIFNNNKSLKKSSVISLDNFENRIGTRMNIDDSFELFGSSMAIEKTDDNTVIYYAGSGKPVPLRPYIMPNDEWLEKYNDIVE